MEGPRLRGSAPGRTRHWACSVGKVEQVRSFGIIEAKRPRQAVENLRRRPADAAAFQSRVVLDAYARQGRDLAATQADYTSVRASWQTNLLRCDLSATRDEELANLLTDIHDGSQ